MDLISKSLSEEINLKNELERHNVEMKQINYEKNSEIKRLVQENELIISNYDKYSNERIKLLIDYDNFKRQIFTLTQQNEIVYSYKKSLVQNLTK